MHKIHHHSILLITCRCRQIWFEFFKAKYVHFLRFFGYLFPSQKLSLCPPEKDVEMTRFEMLTEQQIW